MGKQRYIRVSRNDVTSYQQFTEDLHKIIEKNQRNIFDFDSYEISITLRNTLEDVESKGTRSLMFLVDNEVFENRPEDIRDEEELRLLINNMNFNGKIGCQYLYDRLYNFFKVFITLNYNGNEDIFEKEYNLDLDSDLSQIPKDVVCYIFNTELAWMGLSIKFFTLDDDTYNFQVL